MLRIFSKKEEPQSDAALVAHYQQTGDQASLSQLYERYIELVYGLCLKYFNVFTSVDFERRNNAAMLISNLSVFSN